MLLNKIIIFYRREDKPKTKENQGIDIESMEVDNKYFSLY
jgi:hypothetical protein